MHVLEVTSSELHAVEMRKPVWIGVVTVQFGEVAGGRSIELSADSPRWVLRCRTHASHQKSSIG